MTYMQACIHTRDKTQFIDKKKLTWENKTIIILFTIHFNNTYCIYTFSTTYLLLVLSIFVTV